MIKPSGVNAAGRKREKENIKFRAFLKNNADYDDLDKHFLELHNRLFSEYDCCRCNNCCKAYSPVVGDDDVGAIASFLAMSKTDIIKKYLISTAEGYEMKSPCKFLGENGKCAIQDCKPKECRDFPYTDKPDRMGSLLSVMSYTEQCPVVFEIIETLKDKYRFRRS